MYRGEFMANVADVKADITSFNEYQLRELFNHFLVLYLEDFLIVFEARPQ
jgi:hypothetical protein